jgi:predicted nucleic acid-binding protein
VDPFFDTNILLYSISREPQEALKRNQAIALLEREDGALSVQVLQEFYVQATRPKKPAPLSHQIAAGLIKSWTRFRVQDMTVAVVMHALVIKANHRLSYWDSAIIAAAHALGCSRLYFRRHGTRQYDCRC